MWHTLIRVNKSASVFKVFDEEITCDWDEDFNFIAIKNSPVLYIFNFKVGSVSPSLCVRFNG